MEATEQQGPADDLVAGRYRVLETIGQGGMGRVRRAADPLLDREVALKEIALPPGLTAGERERMLGRIRREARIAAGLNHPGIVRVHDIVEHDGDPVIVMEFLDGRSLGTLLHEDGPVDSGYAARIAAAVTAALGHAHEAGVVHRDLKPDNIVVTRDGRIVLTDFGIARTLGDGGARLTEPGSIIGTPAYMAPEQIDGAQPTAAGDLWSLGATLYTALEGRQPFDGDSLGEICVGILHRPAPTPQRAGELAPLIDALLKKDPKERATGAYVLEFLSGLQTPAPEPAMAESAGPASAVPPPREVQPTLDAAAVAAVSAAETELRPSSVPPGDAPELPAGRRPAAAAPAAPAAAPARRLLPSLGILAAAAVWLVAMALPVWSFPLPSGSDSLTGWGLLFSSGSADAKWLWPVAVAVPLLLLSACATVLPAYARYRSLLSRVSLVVGVAALALLGILGTPADPAHFNHCVADQNVYHLSIDEIDACIAASGFSVGYYLCLVALVAVAGFGLWPMLRRRRRLAAAPTP